MRLHRLMLPLAVAALAVSACSSSTNKEATASSAAPEKTCSFDKTVDGVTAVQAATGGADATPELTVAKDAKAPKQLVKEDLCPGDGEAAVPTDTVVVDYVGVGFKSGKKFDSSFDRGQPATFPLNQVIPGWTEGVTGMKPGSARLLLIPADQAYGKQGAPPDIQPDEALAFIVELQEIIPASAAPTP